MSHLSLKIMSIVFRMPTMLTCREFDGFINDYCEGNLGRYARWKFDMHMRLCPPCKEYVDAYKRSIELGKGAFADSDEQVPDEVPKDLVDAVLKAMHKP